MHEFMITLKKTEKKNFTTAKTQNLTKHVCQQFGQNISLHQSLKCHFSDIATTLFSLKYL